jgi:hypothetical protein
MQLQFALEIESGHAGLGKFAGFADNAHLFESW